MLTATKTLAICALSYFFRINKYCAVQIESHKEARTTLKTGVLDASLPVSQEHGKECDLLESRLKGRDTSSAIIVLGSQTLGWTPVLSFHTSFRLYKYNRRAAW